MNKNTAEKYITNYAVSDDEIDNAEKIINELQAEIPNYASKGHGPFLAAIYDKNGKLIVKCANTVKNMLCSNNHAEINAIKEAQQIFKTYDLSGLDLSLYITSEPCMMCIGAIMWSGLKSVYYGVPSKKVEEITGFDEGFKQDWLEEFKKRGIKVCGNIAAEAGEKALKKYIDEGNDIYKPAR